MESNPDFPTARTPQKRVERIGEQTKGLADDVTSWLEIRLRLFQLEVQEKIQQRVTEAAVNVAPFVVGVIAGLFLLVTLALFAGWWLGHPAWGFLVVTALLFLIMAALWMKRKRLARNSGSSEVGTTQEDGSPGRSGRPQAPR